jgi:hypothetical protein
MDFAGIEEVLNQIEGIESCRILGSGNEILEIHVLSGGIRSPKQISRDIETALFTKIDMRIDRKIISIVQFKGGESQFPSRIKLAGVTVSSVDNVVEVEVKLLYDEKEYSSIQNGVNTVSNRNRLVAEATLKALEQIIGQANVAYANNIIINNLLDYIIVTTVVTFRLSQAEELLVGSAVVGSDMNDSIAKATLDAVNRRIKRIKS